MQTRIPELVSHLFVCLHIYDNVIVYIAGGGNPEPKILALDNFLVQLESFSAEHFEKQTARAQAQANLARMNRGDVEAATLIGGVSRLGQLSNVPAFPATENEPTRLGTTTTTTTDLKSSFDKFIDAKAHAETSRMIEDRKLNEILIRREELEVKRMQIESEKTNVDITIKKIEVLQKKLNTLQPGSPLYNILEGNLGNLYKKLT